MARWRFDAIGTRWEIETAGELSAEVRADVLAVVERFDRTWSRFRADSDVTRLSREGGALLSEDAAPMLDAYRGLSRAMDGAVNPLVGASLSALGYDARYSLTPGEPTAAPEDWPRILSWSGAGMATTEPVLVDVGALGKGRLVDLMLSRLGGTFGDVVVDAGGDIRVRGSGAVRIGLEHPLDPTKAIGVLEVSDGALCASAINRRSWGSGLHHVLDARTGTPVRT